MEKTIIDFLNRLYDITNDFEIMKVVAVVTMAVCIVLSLIFERQRRGFTNE